MNQALGYLDSFSGKQDCLGQTPVSLGPRAG